MDWPKIDASRFGEDDATLPTYKTALPTSGSAHVKGAYATIVASLPFDISGVLLTVQQDASVFFMYDIAVGTAGNEVVVFPNLLLLSSGGVHTVQMRYIPLRVQAGQQIRMRAQSSTAAPSAQNVKMQLLSDGLAGIQAPERWEAWGALPVSTNGTVLTSGAANTKGAAVQLIASTSFLSRFFLFSFVTGTVDDEAADFLLGTQPFLTDIYTTNEFNGLWSCLPWAIPAGSQIQARVAAAGGATSSLTVVAYGGGGG